MLLDTAQGRLVKLYEGLVIDVPDFGTLMGLNFGIVMYANSDFAPHSPAPTQLEGTVSPTHCLVQEQRN